ncbi:ABC transporter substrate-binding protein, partial [Methylobacterium sp. J-070]|uniref:ABC transporter substrate-binding protein n=1 Tax=Methylobacterium sp. J-070 TaxID=2836650 RepID=UPI001FBADCAC
ENGRGDVLGFVGLALREVYSADVSEFVFAAAVQLLRTFKPDVMYVSTTDDVQHKAGPGSTVAVAFYAMFDRYVGELDAAGCALVMTADHGMNDKHLPDGPPDVTPYGKGLADETLKAFKAKGGAAVLVEGINPGEKDYSALVSKLKSANVDLVYYGGYHTEAGLILRQMHDQGLKAIVAGGDAVADKEFAQIAGPAAEGTLMTFPADPRRNPDAKAAVAALNAKGIDPEAFTLYAYAAVQVLAKAMAETGSSDGRALADWLHRGEAIDTVVGPIAYDKKGDITRLDYVMHVWTKGPDGKIDYAGHALTP